MPSSLSLTPDTGILSREVGQLPGETQNLLGETTSGSLVTDTAGSAPDDTGMTANQFSAATAGVGAAATQIIGGVFSGIIGGINNDTAKIRAKTAEDARKFNAEMAEAAARQVYSKLESDEAQYMQGVGRLIASQKSAAAGQGIKVGTGVSAALEREARDVAVQDLNALRSAAAQQALGLKAQAFNQRVAGMVESGNIMNQAQQQMLMANARMTSNAMTGLYGLARAIPTSRGE